MHADGFRLLHPRGSKCMALHGTACALQLPTCPLNIQALVYQASFTSRTAGNCDSQPPNPPRTHLVLGQSCQQSLDHPEAATVILTSLYESIEYQF